MKNVVRLLNFYRKKKLKTKQTIYTKFLIVFEFLVLGSSKNMLNLFVASPESINIKLFTHHRIETHLVSIHIDSIAPETNKTTFK